MSVPAAFYDVLGGSLHLQVRLKLSLGLLCQGSSHLQVRDWPGKGLVLVELVGAACSRAPTAAVCYFYQPLSSWAPLAYSCHILVLLGVGKYLLPALL